MWGRDLVNSRCSVDVDPLVTMRCSRLALALVVLWAGGAFAKDGEWQTVVTGPITIKNRSVPNTPIKEIWAEGEIAAPVQDIQATAMTPERFRYFMPYVTDAREISPKQPDGSVYVYTATDFPFVGKRDYVVRTWLLESVKEDGSGAFRNRWEAYPDYIPTRSDVIRLKVDSGSWVVTPVGDGSKSWAVYKFMVDPGGWIPSFAANMGNEKGVTETYKAMEKEALRRKNERLSAAAKDAGPKAPSPDAAAPK